jgi:hypothetical protein
MNFFPGEYEGMVSKWFIDKGFGDFTILRTRSDFSGFSRSENRGILLETAMKLVNLPAHFI